MVIEFPTVIIQLATVAIDFATISHWSRHDGRRVTETRVQGPGPQSPPLPQQTKLLLKSSTMHTNTFHALFSIVLQYNLTNRGFTRF